MQLIKKRSIVCISQVDIQIYIIFESENKYLFALDLKKNCIIRGSGQEEMDSTY